MPAELVGASQKMQGVRELIKKVGPNDCPVLILGESGTGKELVARAIHLAGPRRDKPFIAVDCSALVPTLIESELFSHLKGAFTGTTANKQGLLPAANGGTLFLDEIAELSPECQAKVLRAIQEKGIKPVGSNQWFSIDARVIAATSRDLQSRMREGTFRQDLYFRLNVVQIKLPPLRDRKSDIPLLVAAFLARFSDPSRSVCNISDEAQTRLMAYDWPGNVRELENAIERAVALGAGPVLQLEDLPPSLDSESQGELSVRDNLLPLEKLEQRAIFYALRQTNGDTLAAACLLAIGESTLYRKLKWYHR